MSIADKLIEIAENEKKVYDAGLAKGTEQGKSEGYAEAEAVTMALIERSATEIDIPEGTTKIGYSAFQHCQKLERVSIPDSVTYIDYYAFNNCRSLKSIDIPTGVTDILSGAIQDCWALTELTVPALVKVFTHSVFANCTSLKKFTALGKVTRIINAAFKNCTECLVYDFLNCQKCPTLDGTDAFSGINENAKIYVPASLYDEWVAATNWAEFADYITIEHSEGLEYYYDSEKEGYCLIGRGSFDGSIIVVPPIHNDGVNGSHPVVSVGAYTDDKRYGDILCGDDKLERVELPESVTDVMTYSFSSCVNLKKLYMPGIRGMGSFEYYGLTSLEYVKFGKNFTGIGGGSFSGSGNAVYDFSEAEAVPSFYSYGYGEEFGTDPTIKVPAALLEEWKNATNWSLYADHIVAAE